RERLVAGGRERLLCCYVRRTHLPPAVRGAVRCGRTARFSTGTGRRTECPGKPYCQPRRLRRLVSQRSSAQRFFPELTFSCFRPTSASLTSSCASSTRACSSST